MLTVYIYIYNYKNKLLNKINGHWEKLKNTENLREKKYYINVHHIFNQLGIVAYVQFHVLLYCLTLYCKLSLGH